VVICGKDRALSVFYCHSPHIWLLARDARIRAAAVVAANADSPAVDALAAIILAAAASEGFINELGTLCINTRPDSHFPPSVVTLGNELLKLEQARRPTLAKYATTATILSGKQMDERRRPYRELALLFDARNALMHIKAKDQAGPRQRGKLTFTMPEVVKKLQRKKLAKASQKEVAASWLQALETDKVAAWACTSSLTMTLAVLKMMPDFVGDPAEHFKRQFRAYKALP
jgi:hypothetical protein